MTNEAKSVTMMISGQCPADLKDKFKFKWTTTGFRYLGIIITPHHITAIWSELWEINYGNSKRPSKVGDFTLDFDREDKNCKNECITKVVVVFVPVIAYYGL